MNEKNKVQRLKLRVKGAAAKVAAAGTALVASSGAAMASVPAPFDSASIITKIEENAATGALIIGAFILAVWGLRSMGLFRGRG